MLLESGVGAFCVSWCGSRSPSRKFLEFESRTRQQDTERILQISGHIQQEEFNQYTTSSKIIVVHRLANLYTLTTETYLNFVKMLSTCVQRQSSSFAESLHCRYVTIAERCFSDLPDAGTIEVLETCFESASCGAPDLNTATEMTAYVLAFCKEEEKETSGERGVRGRRRPISLSGEPYT